MIKLGIIGAGPSSFYVASRLLSALPPTKGKPFLNIHIYDRLWAPHGLVRYGVAPDHPEVKNCTHKFDLAATDPRLRFFGNVNIGSSSPLPHALSLPLSALLPHYTHLLFATGCTVPILHPALPPSQYCVPALSLVHWYTQHPSRPSPPPLEQISHVALIGQGNVSLDVARMLLTPPAELRKYDVPQSVLSVLERSAVQHVSIVGRRGPLQAAFTTKELREMMNLPDASMAPLDPSVLKIPEGEELTRQQSRTLQLLQKGSKNKPGSTRKTWSLDFFRSPTGLVASSTPPSPLHREDAELTLAHTMLDPSVRAVPTGETSTLSTSLVVTSLGHRSEPDAAWYDPALGHLRAVGGRVVGDDGRTVRRVYASGWAATGAHGVLAGTMMDAYSVAQTILVDSLSKRDLPIGNVGAGAATLDADPGEGQPVTEVLPETVASDGPPPEVEAAQRTGVVTGYEDWLAVSKEEVRRGETSGKERERMSWEEAHEFLSGRPA
ncbi:Probable NADPH:adrenodoxin oxidoreductase [Sparassis crispa]|uniref:Probable NADPH:adrenodoxin oxidoreductase n=1 Tax=Sparassis crispa TaxID=139825 RepID=A0A401GTS6_9APHY|nr:Probable NADPH:adrenodoxin oxidoreductase [Sparassis crispa]GBE85590.1 Probable NADPH:adrenodoxin oxidoreductase [Sparassis crispa]